MSPAQSEERRLGRIEQGLEKDDAGDFVRNADGAFDDLQIEING